MSLGLKPCRPPARSVDDAKDLYVIVNHPICHNIGSPRNNHFSCAFNSSRASKIRKVLQKIYVGQDSIYKVVCRSRALRSDIFMH